MTLQPSGPGACKARGRLRRGLLAACLAISLATKLVDAVASEAATGGVPWTHAFATYGEPRYPPGFAHFDYVNPTAPKGGTVRLTGTVHSPHERQFAATTAWAAPGVKSVENHLAMA